MKLLKQAQRHKVAKAQRNKNIKNSAPLCSDASMRSPTESSDLYALVPNKSDFIFLRNPQLPFTSYQLPITNSSGMALVIVVAIIAVLSSIGVTFMYTMRMEEKTAFNYMQGLKASYIAKSGIEHAIAVLKSDGRDTGFVAYETNRWGYRNDDLTDSTFSAYDIDDAYSVNSDTTYISPYSDSIERKDSRWIYVYDANDTDIVGRYAVLITDESSKININTAGNVEAQQGWKPFEISFERFFDAGTQPPLNWSLAPQILANNILDYLYGSDEEAGDVDWDDNADSVILEHDGIDNDADGAVDESGEGVDDPYEFV